MEVARDSPSLEDLHKSICHSFGFEYAVLLTFLIKLTAFVVAVVLFLATTRYLQVTILIFTHPL